MKRWLSLLAVVFVMMVGMPASAFAASTEEPQTLRVYNWGEYVSDGSDGTLDVLAEFEERYPNIKLEYTTYASNEEMYAKLKSGSASYDVIIPSDYMVSRMIAEDMLLKLDFDNIPNFSDVMEDFKNPEYDPTNEYSVPYSWGTVCLIVNTDLVREEVDSWNALWDINYDGNILMFNNSRDAFGIALKRLGFSQNSTDPEELELAKQSLIEQKGFLQSYVMDEIFDKMESGEAAIAPYYTGDGLIMQEENPSLDVILPKEGTNLFVDAMVVPKGAKNKEGAETFINFMCETEIAYANVIDYLGYSTPIQSVYDQLDEEILNDGVSYPSEEYLATCDTFINLSDEDNKNLEEMWVDVMAAETGTEGGNPIFLILIFAVLFGLSIYRAVKKHCNREL
jgi:spermidine/putrescine transport system substrate-binding protein